MDDFTNAQPGAASQPSIANQTRIVRFAKQPSVRNVESIWTASASGSLSMADQRFQTFASNEVSDEMMREAATLFSENYGIWGERSEKSGTAVILSARRLQQQYLPDDRSHYTRVLVNGQLAGNAFACRWSYNGETVCWITQLVVHKNFRERGLARGLLTALKQDSDKIFGVISSHPAACLAAATSYGRGIERVSLDFIKVHAEAILKSSPISYIKLAKLHGTIHGQDSTEMVSGVDTDFWVDHEEPLNALRDIREELNWPLGDLYDGSEFLLIVPGTRRRSRSRSIGHK